MLKLDHNASKYAAPGIWKIDDVIDLKNDNFWPIATSSGDLNCYTTPPKKECGDCIFVDMNGIASSGTVVDPSGSTPSSGLFLPRKAWIVSSDGWEWDNWWWDGYYNWNWYWRYSWYNNWYNYGWYWGWGCYRYYHHIDQTNLFDVTCNDTFSDKYPTCGTGSISVNNFSWGNAFNTILGVSFTPSSSGLIPNTSSFTYTYNNVTPGITNTETKVSTYTAVNNSGIIPWNATWNRSYNTYTINKSIYLGVTIYETTYDYVVNTGNTDGSNGLDIVFSSYTYNTSNGYNSYYHGSLPDDDPLWSNLNWKAGYPNNLLSANPGSFWFAITQKRTSVYSGYFGGTYYDNNGSGYPVPNNYGQNTEVTQITRFYLYKGCYSIEDITEQAITGTPLVIGQYTPNQQSVNPLNYWYNHTTINVCDSQYLIIAGLPTINIVCGNKLYFNSGIYPIHQPGDVTNQQCCPNPVDPYDYYDTCLFGCTPGEGGVPWDDGSQQGLTALDEWESHPKWLAYHQLSAPFDCKYYKGGNYGPEIIVGAANQYSAYRNGQQLYQYDSSLYYGYHLSDISGIQKLYHPKIAWSVNQYTKNQSECESHTPVNGEVWSTFYPNALEKVNASTTSPFWWWGWNFGFFGPYFGWGWCNSNYFCLDNNNKMKTIWSNNAWLHFDEDCLSNLDNEYPISQTYCGPCSTNRTVIDASGINNFSISVTGQRKGSSISIDRHCYLYKNPYIYAGKTVKLYYEPISGIIPIINNRLYDTDTYYNSGNYTINLTGITLNNLSWFGSTQGSYRPVTNWINNNLVFAIRTSGTGTNSVFSYRCPDVKIYWPYCTGNIIPVRILPSC